MRVGAVSQPPTLYRPPEGNSQWRMKQLMAESADLMNDMAAASLKEIDWLGEERKQRYADKQTVDAEVDAAYSKLGKLDQFDTFLSCVQIASSIGLSLVDGNPIALASAAVGAVRLFDATTGWITDPTLKGGLKWLSWGAGIATYLSGPVAGSDALKSVLEPGLTGASMAATASRGASELYKSRLQGDKARASNASTQFRADLADLSLRKEAAYSAIDESHAVHQGGWSAFLAAMDQEAAARRRMMTRGRS